MKTSTKLLIVFFTCIPLSLLAYNYLLRREFLKGRFVEDVRHESTIKHDHSKVRLPAFNHIVVMGGLRSENLNNRAGGSAEAGTDSNWRPNVDIKQSKHYGYDVLRIYSDWIKTKIKHDTLFISFYERKSNRYPLYISLTIHAKSVKSVKVSQGSYFLSGSLNKILEVTGSNATVSIANLISNHLNIHANSSSFHIADNDKVKKLSYSLQNSSSLQIANRSVKGYGATKGDSTSTILLSGRPGDMEKYLVAEHSH